MNSKASKQQLTWPPLLQMMKDEPCVDSTFRNVEKINTPYINDMLSPVWIKDTGSVGVYDAEGHRYEIIDGYLTRDGNQLFAVNNEKFVKEDITEQMIDYHDYDLTDEYEAYSIWNADTNNFTVSFNGYSITTPTLYTEGVIITSRLRIIDNNAYFIVYFDVDDTGYMYLLSIDESGDIEDEFTQEVIWWRQQIRRSATSSMVYEIKEVDNANPIISIGKVESGVIGISLVSSYGKALDSTRNYFATYFLYNNNLYVLGDTSNGATATPTSETSSITVTNTYSGSFKGTTNRATSTVYGACISTDGSTYYDYSTEGEVGELLDIPTSYVPTATGGTVTIDEVEYAIYNYTATSFDVGLTINSNTSSGDESYTVTAVYNGETYTATWESGNSVTISPITTIMFKGGTKPPASFSSITITWMGEDSEIPTDGTTAYLTRSDTEEVTAGWLVSPNIVIDDGTMYAFWGINPSYSTGNNWSSQTLTTGNIIEESGVISSFSVESDIFTFTISPTEYVTINSSTTVARSNSFAVNQNFTASTVKLNNASATSSYALYESGTAESTASLFLEYTNSNASDLRYYPGTISDSTFNYWGAYYYGSDTVVGSDEDLMLYTVQGYRVPVHSADRLVLGSSATPFNILYNIDSSNTCLPQAISYSSSIDHMGTLLTPWQSIDDDFYIVANSECVIYRDKSNRYYKISIESGNEIVALLDDRYILVNTTSYWNMFDSQQLKKFHYATDYNDRVMFGQTSVPAASSISTGGGMLPGAISSGTITYTRYTATAINAAYNIMPRYAISSLLLPVCIRSRVGVNAEKPFRCYVEESTDTQPIDIYYGYVGSTSAYYKYSIYPYYIYDRATKFDLVDSSYTVSSTLYYSPNMFTQYISGAGNNDMVKEGYATYVLNYYDQIPFFLYSGSTEVSSKNGDDIYYFVLQGQFYAFMNEKIYSMIYSSGVVSSQDAIIDARGMKFIGNNPQIAFFWSPRNRAIYSFTGDANLQHIYNADKFTIIGYDNDNNLKHWYDETTQSIYCATDKGLLVFGPKNIYLFENWSNVTNCQFTSDSVTYITNSDTTIGLVYYPTDGYEQLPLDFETAFYGIGNNEYTAVDRWDIVLVDKEGTYPKTEITVGVRSITDVTVKSEEKTFKITPDMWDKWSHSILIRYAPKLQKGQGIRLYIKTPMVVQRIVPHIMDMGTGTLTKRGV